MSHLLRPCFLVVDREFAGTISTRKLVLETAKFNVITAYSYEEGLATLDAFPRIDAVVATADRERHAHAFLEAVRTRYPQVKTILTSAPPDADVADVHIAAFAPDKLLDAARELFPIPAGELERKELDLAKEIGEA